MKKSLTRRTFIKNGAYATLAAGVTSTLGCGGNGGNGNGRLTFQSRRQAVVIGSGFGGSVAALRLGEAGISTALIERGKHWVYSGESSYPTLADLAQGDKRTTWMSDFDAITGQIPMTRYAGMLERITGDTVDSIVGAGLGGGSLVYGGVLLQPRQDLFEAVFPYINYADMNSTYYPRVLSRVSGGTVPDAILNHDTLCVFGVDSLGRYWKDSLLSNGITLGYSKVPKERKLEFDKVIASFRNKRKDK